MKRLIIATLVVCIMVHLAMFVTLLPMAIYGWP